MKTPAELQAEGWRPIRLAKVAWLVTERHWKWAKFTDVHGDGRPHLALVSPRGKWWRFRLQRRAWIKPMQPQTDSSHGVQG